MRAVILLAMSLAVSCCSITALGNSEDMPLPRKVRSLPVVAEVRLMRIEVRSESPSTFRDLLCDCEVLQAFKLSFVTNRLTLRMNFAALAAKYEGKRAVVFAFESPYGEFSPYGGKLGFILEGETYHDRYSRKEIKYDELIRQLRAVIEANQQAGADGRQPYGSEANRPSSAASSAAHPDCSAR
jgi:hypothetical protein